MPPGGGRQAEALAIEGFKRFDVRDKQREVRKPARFGPERFGQRGLVDGPLSRRPRRIDRLGRHVEQLAAGQLKRQREAQRINCVERAIGAALDHLVLAQFGRDRIETGRIGHAIDDTAQLVARAERIGMRRIAFVHQIERSAIGGLVTLDPR